MTVIKNDPATKHVISGLVLGLIWLAVPVTLLAGASEKTTVTIVILAGSVLFFHACLTYINKDLITSERRWQLLLLMLLFGPIEIDYLNQTLLKTSPDTQRDQGEESKNFRS